MDMEQSKLSIGNGGWVRYMRSDLPAAAYLRYVDRDGRLVPVEIYLETIDGAPVNWELLRHVPVGDVDAWLNGWRGEALRASLLEPAPDLQRAARAFMSSPSEEGARRARTWVDDMLRSQTHGSDVPPPPLPKLEALEAQQPPDLSAALQVPAAKPYGDDFYQQVADVYRRIVGWVASPAAVIADENGVPTTTSHRWIKEARRRRLLEPGRQVKGRRDGER